MNHSINHAKAERRELRDQSAAPDSSDPSNRSARTHLPGLDGLRGLAILMVMILHFGGGIATHAAGADLWLSRFTGVGWIGLDLLIVLSLRRETLIKVCSAMIVAVLALRLGLVASGFERIYFFTPCRLDGLMAGALLSLVLRGQRTVQSLVPAAWKSLLACGAALAGIWLFKGLDSDHWTMTTVGFTLIAAFFTAATVQVLAAPRNISRLRIFTSKTLTFLGK